MCGRLVRGCVCVWATGGKLCRKAPTCHYGASGCRVTFQLTIRRYRIDSFLDIPEKAITVVAHLIPTLVPTTSPLTPPPSPFPSMSSATTQTPWTISFTSASNFPLAAPTWIAKGLGTASWLGLGVEGVNPRIVKWLLLTASEGLRPRATVLSDFYRQAPGGGEFGEGGDRGLAELLVALNFV